MRAMRANTGSSIRKVARWHRSLFVLQDLVMLQDRLPTRRIAELKSDEMPRPEMLREPDRRVGVAGGFKRR